MNALIRVLREPTVVRGWAADDWNRFLPLARNARLLGRCLVLFEDRKLLDQVPQRILDQLRGALVQTRYVQGQALREWRLVKRVLDEAGVKVLPLKGVAYLLADLPPARWRNLSDIDVLVAPDAIAHAEQALKARNWLPSGEFDAYDEHYYRDWMHEVPPLMHRDRDFEVDLHHNLAPPVSRVRIDASKLWRATVMVTDREGREQAMLGAAETLLHNAVHLFMNDELRGGLRDVVDFSELFTHYNATVPAFEQTLLTRADDLGCERALYYAVSTARRLLGLATSDRFADGVERAAPNVLIAQSMRRMIDQVLAPSRVGSRRSALAEWLLFVRSHWIRMPPLMLARHLFRKATTRRHAAVAPVDFPG